MMLSSLLRTHSIKQYPEFDTAFQNALMSIKEFLDANKIDESFGKDLNLRERRKNHSFFLPNINLNSSCTIKERSARIP